AERRPQAAIKPPAARSEPPPACHAGCFWCCYMHVSATVPEVLLVADHVRRTWSPTDPAALLRRARNADGPPRGLNPPGPPDGPSALPVAGLRRHVLGARQAAPGLPRLELA